MSSYIQSMRDVKDALLNTQLKSVPLFNSFSDNQLDLLYKVGVIKRFEKGCIAIHQGSPGDTFYIVISGRANVTLLNEDGKEIVLSTLKEGDFFGELSLLDDETRSASVIIVEDTTLFLLSRKQFYQLLIEHPNILRKVLKEICTRLRHADEKIESLAFLDVYGRTIRVLQQIATDRGIKTKTGIEIVHAPTHQELSTIVGASREAITRIINVLKKNRNVISYKGRKIVLSDCINKPVV